MYNFPIYKYILTITSQIKLHKYTYTTSQIYKYNLTNIQIQLPKYTNTTLQLHHKYNLTNMPNKIFIYILQMQLHLPVIAHDGRYGAYHVFGQHHSARTFETNRWGSQIYKTSFVAVVKYL